MEIQEKVKVSRFANDWHRVTVNVIYTSNWFSKLLEERAAKMNITLQQFNALRILRGQYPNPSTNNLIKERMIISTVDISRLMDRIVQKGLVSKSKKSSDKRAVDLYITQKGLDLLEDLDKEMLLEDVLTKNLTLEEASQLSNLLDKMRGE